MGRRFSPRFPGMNPKRFFPLLLSLLIGLLGFGCGGPAEDRPDEEPVLRIAVIPKGTTHVFWQSVRAGALAAGDALNEEGVNVRVIWQGPLLENDRTQQMELVETFTTRRVDGIVLAPLDHQALVAPVRAANRAGIPVAIFDSALSSEIPISFIASDNYRGGELAALHLGESLGGTGKVLVLRYQVGSASTEEREAGFLDAIGQTFPEIEIVSSNQYAGPNRETALTAATNLLNRFGHDLDGVFASNESATAGMLLALRNRRDETQPLLVGFDSAPELIEGLRRGDVSGLMVQNPYNMGYLGVRTMVAHLQGEAVEPVIDTGVTLVTADRLDSPDVQRLLDPTAAD